MHDTVSLAKMILYAVLAVSSSSTARLSMLRSITTAQCSESGVCAACAAASDDAYPYWNGEQCVSCSVGTDRKKPLFDKARGVCSSECPKEAPWLGDDRVCRECPESRPYWNGKRRICQTCAEATDDAHQYWNPTTGKCVFTCPRELRPNAGKVCKTCEQIDNARPFFDPESEKCVACTKHAEGRLCLPCSASAEMPYWNPLTRRCESCAATFSGNGLWDPNTRACVASCPADTPQNGRSCMTCRQADVRTPFWDGSRCVACSRNLEFVESPWGGPGRCEEPCEASAPFRHEGVCTTCAAVYNGELPYYDPKTRRCTAKCSVSVENWAQPPRCLTCDELEGN